MSQFYVITLKGSAHVVDFLDIKSSHTLKVSSIRENQDVLPNYDNKHINHDYMSVLSFVD